jgi:hypothetical protein
MTRLSFCGGERMAHEEKNEYGCPFRDQTGMSAIKNFLELIAALSPELRAAFEHEREARERELEAYRQIGDACYA